MDFREAYFDVWKTAWDFHKQFVNIGGTDEDWQTVVNTAGEMAERYKNKPGYEFMKALILSILDELERVDKQRQKQEDMENEKK